MISHTDVGVSTTTWQDLVAQSALISFMNGKVHESQYKMIFIARNLHSTVHTCGLKFRVVVNEITLFGTAAQIRQIQCSSLAFIRGAKEKVRRTI